MNDDCIFSSPPQKENGEWPTPIRKVVRSLQRDGLSQREIVKKTTLPRRSIRRILHQEKSKRDRKKILPRPHLMTQRDIRRCIRHISKDWSTRRLTFDQVKAQLDITALARTIRRELRRSGYRRCIACPRPYISRKQAKRRLGFALEHRWWGTSDAAAFRQDGKVKGD